jgi:hypothetical protein
MRHIHPIQPILTIALIIILVVIMRKRKAASQPPAAARGAEPRAAATRPAKAEEPPEVVFMRLRQQALATLPQNLGPAGQVADDEPYGAVMEIGVPNNVVTLACFADGDAGIFYKAGGGMRGGGAHEAVRKAAKEFIALAKSAMPTMSRTSDYPLPEADMVRFYVLTPRGTVTVETDRQSLGDTQDPLSHLYYGGQEVVTQMRQVQEQRAS